MDFDGDGRDDWYCIGEQNARLPVFFPSRGSGFGLSLPAASTAPSVTHPATPWATSTPTGEPTLPASATAR
jgi:hypothetical protein